MTNNNEDNFTTLVNVKWTPESMSQIHFKMFNKFINKINSSKKFTEEEKVKRIRDQLIWFTMIEQLILRKDIAFKKK